MRIAFAGTPDFAATTLAGLALRGVSPVVVYTRPDRRAGRGRRLAEPPVKSAARAAGLPVEQPARWDAETCARFARFELDLFVTIAYGMRLPPAALDAPRLGCVNAHLSLLPRWRGPAPVVRAIEAGDEETGVSLMQMAPVIDTGPVIARRARRIAPDATPAALSAELAADALELFAEFLRAPEAMLARAQPQPENGAAGDPQKRATYAAPLSQDEAWIDWQRPAVEVERKVRALSGWPVARTRCGGETLLIRAGRCVDLCGAPGRVVRAARREGFVVGCAPGAFEILRLQLPGKAPVSAADFINARHPRVGAALE